MREAVRDRVARGGGHRRGRGVIQIDTGQDSFQLRVGARRLYSAQRSALHSAPLLTWRDPCPKSFFPAPKAVSKAVSLLPRARAHRSR